MTLQGQYPTSDIPSGYDYVYIELKCTIAAYDEPDTVDRIW
ncbi:MAG: hypothetical protein ACLVAU_13290 [Ruminococcus sp.]